MFKNSEPSLFDTEPYNTWVKSSLTNVLIAVGRDVGRVLEAFWLVSPHLLPGVPVAVKSSGEQELSGHHSSSFTNLCAPLSAPARWAWLASQRLQCPESAQHE